MSNPEIAFLVAALVAGALAGVQALRSEFQDLDAIGLVVLAIGVIAFLLL